MRNQTGINAANFLYGPTPAPKKAIDLRPKASAPTGSLTPGRGGRRRMPRPGEGTHEVAKAVYNFLEPGYVHAARTGTVPESAVGKGLLAAETALDFAPGIGKAVGMALPFGFMRKVDPVEIKRQTLNIKSQKNNDDFTSTPTLDKYVPEEFVMNRVPPVEVQKTLLESNNLTGLILGSTKKEAQKWREAVKSLPPEHRQGFPIHNIDKMYPTGKDTEAILANQMGVDDLRGELDMESVFKNPNFPLLDRTAEAAENIDKAAMNIMRKVGSGQIGRTVGHKEKAQLVKDFIAAEADRQAHLKAGSQVGNKAREITRDARIEAGRRADKFEKNEVNRLFDEHAFTRGHGDESAAEFLPEFRAQAREDTRAFHAEELNEQLESRYEAKTKATVKRSIPVQRKEILNQLQETGTYNPKNRMKKGAGEEAEALRQMQKMLQSYNPMNMRIRSV
jgi:hypothetical protein